MSETKSARPVLSKFCNGIGMDIGFGGTAIVPSAITFDMSKPYCPSIENHAQILRGDCRSFPYICDNALDYIYSSHLLEDFTYAELIPIIHEWRRILKMNGLLVINCPNQQKFLEHCRKTGQGINLAHKEPDFSYLTFKTKVIDKTGNWQIIFLEQEVKPYSWYLVVKKVDKRQPDLSRKLI